MLSSAGFVKQSLDTHLFFARVMKEHAYFLAVNFPPKDAVYILQADSFKTAFEKMLSQTVALSNSVVSAGVLESGEVITRYTLDAEKKTAFYTGMKIQTGITQSEAGLTGGEINRMNPVLEKKVIILNDKIINLLNGLIRYKTKVLADVRSCKLFSFNYPHMTDHIIREAELYLKMVQKLQKREEIHQEKDIQEELVFWNDIMAEHSEFIRGMLDPTETQLIKTANDFAEEFKKLTKEAKQATDLVSVLEKVTEDSLKATQELRTFKEQGTKGILDCEIQSVILPLLSDHVLREANHYLRLLKRNIT
ncbi:MAG: DUF2935 domain-containing protein [Clostridiales bacterium]|nr:DUF2935 domain-containing protein [Clostridiales bacterium]